MDRTTYLELHYEHHVCARGLDPYAEPRCPHPAHDGDPKSRALRTHVWRNYVEKEEGNLRWMGAMCDNCGQQFRHVYFMDPPESVCPG